jgi:ribosomal protein S18 acetylase RimI-like enzyme
MRRFSRPALAELAQQSRVHNRLDWWALDDWHNSDAFFAVPSATPNSPAAALLIVPIELDDIHHLSSARAPVAWLRWCAVADRQSPSATLRALLAQAEAQLRATQVRELWCVCQPHDWLAMNLRDLGFVRRDELVTMTRTSHKPVNWLMPNNFTLRVLHPEQFDLNTLAKIHALDADAFEPHWRFSAHMLRQAMVQSVYLTVAEYNNQIVGYQCAIGNGDGVSHMMRLAVHPELRQHGVGTALFANAVNELQRAGASEITLNTPASNTSAQKMYRRFGFSPLVERVAALCKRLSDPAQA